MKSAGGNIKEIKVTFFYEGVFFRSLVFSLKSQFDSYAMDSNTEWF